MACLRFDSEMQVVAVVLIVVAILVVAVMILIIAVKQD
jgi:hypothetical protein